MFKKFILFLFICLLIININKVYAGVKKGDIYIKAKGLISRPGTYKLERGSRLSDFLQEIWPPRSKAYLKDTVLYRKQLKIDRKVELIGIRRELLHLKGLNKDVKNKLRHRFVKLRSTGRVVIHATLPVLLLNTKENIKLKNGDVFIFRAKPKYVFVEGAVKNPGKYAYDKNRTYDRYLNEAKGLRNNAASGFLYIIRVSGKIEKISSRFIVWNKHKKRWELALFEKPKIINPGDIIFVPFNYGNITSKLTGLILAVYKRTGVLLNYSPDDIAPAPIPAAASASTTPLAATLPVTTTPPPAKTGGHDNGNGGIIGNLYNIGAQDIESYPSFLLSKKDYALGFTIILGGSFLLDRGINTYMIHHQSHIADFASNAVYPFGKFYYTFPAVGLFSLYGYYTKNIKLMNASFTSIESGLTAGVITEGIKVIAGRERPYGTNNPFEFEPFNINNKYNSFPSGDAVIAWSMITPYAVYYKQPLLYLIPAAVDLERVYKNKHWISDTIMGSAIGFSIGYLFSNNHITKDITFDSNGNNILINVKF